MKRVALMVVFLLSIIVPSITNASCTNEEKERIKKLLNNASYIIEEVMDVDGNLNLKTTFTGIYGSLNLFILSGSYEIDSYDQITGEMITYLRPGKTYPFRLSATFSCDSSLYRDITITIPNYNPYYNDQLCDNLKEHKLCQKWTDEVISYETFEKKLNEYMDSLEKKDNNDDNKNENTTKKRDFYYYYEKYYWWALGSLIATLGLLIYLWIKENNRNKL